MEKCSKRDLKMAAGIMAASFLLGGCSAAAAPANTQKTLNDDPSIKAEINFREVGATDYDEEMMDRLYRKYCFELFSQTVRDYGDGSNVMISPASIMMALDMIAAGAKGDSLDQLTNLFAAGQGPLTQQAYAADLMDKINGSKDIDFRCANAIWNNGLLLGNSVNMDYVDYVQDTFLAEYVVTDFNDKTPDEINSWIGKHTDHMIEQVINELDPSTVMVLVNAIAFEAKWEEGYEDYQIFDGDFTAADGTTKTVTFLSDTTDAYFETDKATGFMKMYEGGQYAFLAILPSDASVNANEFAAGFTPEDYEAFINSVSYRYSVYSEMPEFAYDYEMTLNDTVANMGCGDIFDGDKADLSGIAGAPGDLFVSKIIHKTHIEVDREGTKAAAATVVMVDYNSVVEMVSETREVICNRPYMYAIVDVETMAPVFVGTVNAI